MNHFVARRWITLVVLAALLGSVPVLLQRQGAESTGKQVLLTVDGEEVKELLRHDGHGRLLQTSVEEIYVRLKEAGIGAVGVYEWTLEDAIDRGHVFVHTRASLMAVDSPLAANLPPDDEKTLYIGFSTDAEKGDRWVAARMNELLPRPPLRTLPDHIYIWKIDRSFVDQMLNLPLGFHPEDIQQVQRAGLRVVPRIRSSVGSFGPRPKQRLAALEGADLGPIVFAGQAIDFKSPMGQALLREIPSLGVPVGLIEFTAQDGVAEAVRIVNYDGVITHSITSREMAADFMHETLAKERYVRAVKERQARLLYVRFFDLVDNDETVPTPSIVSRNVDYITEIAGALTRAGFALGVPVSLPLPPVNLAALMLAVMAVGAVGGWLIGRLVTVWFRHRWLSTPVARHVWGILGVVAISAVFWVLWLKGYTIAARQVAAFAVSIVFPVAGIELVLSLLKEERFGRYGRFSRTLGAFFAATAVSLAGAALVAVFMTEPRMMLKLELFRGVKAAHVLPLGIVLLFWLGRWLRQIRRDTGERSLIARLSAWVRTISDFEIRIRLVHLLTAFIALLILGVVVLRTGNDGLPVAQIEQSLRLFLENVFVIRPRTKEMLFGHPLLVVGFFLAAGRVLRGDDDRLSQAGSGVLLGCVLAGTLGQLSMINTFAHAHSPLEVSFYRTVLGLAGGLAIGLLLTAPILLIERKAERKREH